MARALPAEAGGGVNALSQRIAALIAAQGPIAVAEFMAIANDAYYSARDPFGAKGDFITAPEISQAFGELLGLWCVQLWHDQGRPRAKHLVELGPGRGTLMADALRAARLAPEFFEGLEIVLVESSPQLRALQQERLKDVSASWPVRWTQHFDSSLAGRPLFLLANEFFDVLPVRQYVKTAKGWRERMVVTGTGGALSFALSPVPVPSEALPPGRDDAPDGGVCEVSPAGQALTGEVARIVARRGGGALIVDYGYDRPDFGETLQAVSGHTFTQILDDPGEDDLSAHVDFTALAAGALRGGAAAYGPVGQGEFLEAIGIVERMKRLALANPNSEALLRSALDRLVDPAQMGTLFKALAIVPKGAPAPAGF